MPITGLPRRLLPMVAVSILLGACGSLLQNTPAQDLAYKRWRPCEGLAENVLLERVEPDGRIWFRYVEIDGRDRVLRCLKQEAKGGPALPDPVSEIVPRS